MAKIENFRALKQEDFKEEDRDLVGKLGSSLNSFASQLINAFNNNITIDDNLKQEIKQIELNVNSNGVPSIATQIQLTKIGSIKVRGCIVIRAENLTNTTTYPTSTPLVSFSQNNNLLIINHISGLQADNKYRLNILMIT